MNEGNDLDLDSIIDEAGKQQANNSDGEAEFESMDEIKIKRDENGNIVPLRGESMTGKPMIYKPLPVGAMNRMIPVQADEAADLSNDTIAEILRDWVIKPEFPDDLDKEQLEKNFDRHKVNDYVTGVLLGSGMTRDNSKVADTKNNKAKSSKS